MLLLTTLGVFYYFLAPCFKENIKGPVMAMIIILKIRARHYIKYFNIFFIKLLQNHCEVDMSKMWKRELREMN